MSGNAVNDGQRLAIIRLLKPHCNEDKACRLFILSKLIHREVDSVGAVYEAEWKVILKWAHPHYADDNWEVSEGFRAHCAGLTDQYRESVLGQGRLF